MDNSSLKVSLENFRLVTRALGLSLRPLQRYFPLGIFHPEAFNYDVSVGSSRLATFAWTFSRTWTFKLGICRLDTFAGELSIGRVRLALFR